MNNNLLIATPGSAIDFGYIRSAILELKKKYRVVELGYDAHLAHDTVQQLEAGGLTCVAVPGGYHLNAALERTEMLIKSERFCIHGNPLATWAFLNVVLRRGTLGDVAPDKFRSRDRIDLASAALLAMHVALKQPPPRSAESFRVRYI